MADHSVPGDVPDDLVETYLDNLMAATCGTGAMNLFACDQKIEHLNDDFYDGGVKIPLSSNDPGHLFEIGARAHGEGTVGVLAAQEVEECPVPNTSKMLSDWLGKGARPSGWRRECMRALRPVRILWG